MNKIIGLAVGALITVILLGAVLVPVTDSLDPENNLEVLVLAGQSNAAYRGEDVDLVNEEVPLPSSNVYYYGTDAGPIQGQYMTGIGPGLTYDPTFESYGIHSMTEGGHWKIGSYEPMLASHISDVTKRDVLIINVGISSANIQFLLPDSDGGVYASGVIDHALKSVDPKYTVHKIGFVWIQGESNTTTPVNTYIQDFASINSWYAAHGFDECFMVQTQPAKSGNATVAQTEICKRFADVTMASTAPASFTTSNGLLLPDNLHYSQAGKMIIADDIDAVMSLPTALPDSTISILGVVPVSIIVAILVGVASVALRSRD